MFRLKRAMEYSEIVQVAEPAMTWLINFVICAQVGNKKNLNNPIHPFKITTVSE